MNEMVRPPLEPPGREAALNVPPVIVGLVAVLVLIQVARSFLTPDQDLQVLLLFSFLPARYDASLIQGIDLPGGFGADIWTFVTYAGLHGGWPHLVFNVIWMLAFGSAVAWRFGTVRFLLFSALCTAAGAGLHLAFHWGQVVPVIGASAAIAGHMAAAIRFMFQPGAPLDLFRMGGRSSFLVPAHGLVETLRDRRVALFVIVWFAVNLLSGLGALAVGAGSDSIAWQAHIGGFLAGMLLFPIFDPIPWRT